MRSEASCTCASPDALDWIRRVFHQCVSSNAQLLGFYLGLFTIGCWLTAQVPQFLINYKTRRARGLSPIFLTMWLVGDSFNLIGCIASGDQSPTQTYTATYFVLSDTVLLCQYAWYESSTRRRTRAEGGYDEALLTPSRDQRRDLSVSTSTSSSASASASSDEDEDGYAARRGGRGAARPLSPVGGFVVAVAGALAVTATVFTSANNALTSSTSSPLSFEMVRDALSSDDCAYNANPTWMRNFGRIVGYLSTVFYLGGRVAQIMKNRRRRTVEGLSLYMFALAVAANVSYGSSILCRSTTLKELKNAAPWLLGSFGTVALDATILMQFFVFEKRRVRQNENGAGDDDAL